MMVNGAQTRPRRAFGKRQELQVKSARQHPPENQKESRDGNALEGAQKTMHVRLCERCGLK